MITVVIRPHAAKQLLERNIPERLVKDVLRHPGQVLESYRHRKIAQEIIKHQGEEFLIRVVYEERRQILEVVTVYLTKKVRKYWEA